MASSHSPEALEEIVNLVGKPQAYHKRYCKDDEEFRRQNWVEFYIFELIVHFARCQFLEIYTIAHTVKPKLFGILSCEIYL